MPKIATGAVEMTIPKETTEIKTEKKARAESSRPTSANSPHLFKLTKTFLPPSLRAHPHLSQNLQNHPAAKHFILHIHHKRLPFCHPIDGLF